MPSEFKLSDFHSLLHAFDFTGRHIFGDAWRGHEQWARRCDDPMKSKQEKIDLGHEILRLSNDMNSASDEINFAIDDESRDKAQARYLDLHNRQRQTKIAFQHFPRDYDLWISDHAAYQRRRKVEDLLFDAFAKSDLVIYYADGRPIAWSDWSFRKGFKVFLNLSVVRTPNDKHDGNGVVSSNRDSTITAENPYFEPRRYAASVKVNEFNQWLSQFMPASLTDPQLTDEEKCRVILREMILADTTGSKVKNDYREHFKAVLPNLSVRAFDRCWSSEATENMRKSGRPATSKS